jgi:hypothetical protein
MTIALALPRAYHKHANPSKKPARTGLAGLRMGASTYEADTSHVPMLSNPGLVIDVIRAAAKAVTSSQRVA